MKITCKRTELADVLTALSPAIPTKPTDPCYKNVHLKLQAKDAVLTGSDGEVTISIDLPVSYQDLERDGTMLLPHARLAQIARAAIGEDVTLSTSVKDPHRVTIQCGGGEWTLQLEDSESYRMPKTESVKTCGAVAARVLNNALGKTVFCCDMDSTRYALGGVYVEMDGSDLRMVATDSRRLSVAELNIPDATTELPPPVIPAKGVRAVMSAIQAGDVSIGWSKNFAVFEGEHATVTTRLLEGRFPNYRQVIPHVFAQEIEVPRLALLSAVRQSMIVINTESRGIDLCFDTENLTIKGTGQDIGKASIQIPLSGATEEQVTLNPQFIIDALKVMQSDSIALKFNDSDLPFVIEEAGNLHVIMPMARE